MKTLGAILRGIWVELGKTFRILRRNRTGLVGLGIITLMVLMAFIGPNFVPQQQDVNVGEMYQSPSLKHPLGTDFQGMDNLISIVNGGKEIMIVAFLAGIISTAIAVIVGSVSAFAGGWVDSLLVEVVNIWLTVPQFPLLAVLATLIKLDSPPLLAMLLGVLGWAGLARQVRSQVLSLRQREYVEAAVALDLGTSHIIFREMLPNMMSFIAISLVLSMTSAIFQQTGLVFLGLVPLSGANWGVMLSTAYAKGAIYSTAAMWNVLAPVFAIAIFQVGLVMLARSLDEIFNPRLRSEV